MPVTASIRHSLGLDLTGGLDHDLDRLHVDRSIGPRSLVTGSDLDRLPDPVQRYLQFMGVGPGPAVTTFGARFHGRFRMSPSGRWMPCDAVQFNRVDPIARLFRMRVTMAGCLPVVALDSYVAGAGAMRAQLVGAVTVADGHGPEFDVGELTTWVNDAVLLAPALLLGPWTSWSGLGPDAFEVTVVDRGLTSRSIVTIDERGAPVEFASSDRFAALPDGLVRTTWRTPVSRWTTGLSPLPEGASAVWDLPAGPFTYVEGAFDPASITFDGVEATSRSRG